MTQTWNINGRQMNHAEVLEYRRRKAAGLPTEDPVDEVDSPEAAQETVPPPKEAKGSKGKSSSKKAKPVEPEGGEAPKEAAPEDDSSESPKSDDPNNSAEQAEYEKLHAERAWANPKKKERYYELREKFKK